MPDISTGSDFKRPENYSRTIYKELTPISENFEPEALRVNGLDRERLIREGEGPGFRDDRGVEVGERASEIGTTGTRSLSPQLRLDLAILVLYSVLRRRFSVRLLAMLRYQNRLCGKGSNTHIGQPAAPGFILHCFRSDRTRITRLVTRLSKPKFLRISSSGEGEREGTR